MRKLSLTLLAAILVFAAFFGFVPAVSAKAAAEYHAYLGIQTNDTLWVFRNAYDDSKYGFGTESFGGLHSVSGKVITAYDGTFTDAELTADGTYTVTLENPDFAKEKSMSQLFVSTDIPMCDSIKVTDVTVKIDGKAIYTFDKAILNPESFTYVQILCLNIWNKEVTDLFTITPDFKKCEITFTISGLTDAAAAQEEYQDFNYKMAKDHAVVTGYKGSDSTVTLPSEIFGKKVTEIGANAFEGLNVKEVKMPDTVTTIGKQAFYNSKITSVTIPANVTSIKDAAFASCSGLQKITVAKGNAKYAVKDGVLFSKDLKTLVQYPGGLADKAYTIPANVTGIQGGAFDGCSKLARVDISIKVATIGTDAFKGCSKLTIYAPSGSTAYNYAVKQGIKVKKS